MFTGIVEEVGSVVEMDGHRLVVGAHAVLEDTAIGDSIAVNGACLTVVERTADRFTVELSDETLDRTAFGGLKTGVGVDLERAVTPTTRMGGHFVQGHVDGVGTVVALDGTPEAKTLRVRMPSEVARYVVEKGFIAVDGISLTVTDVADSTFAVAVIPYTLEHTVLGERSPGDSVNLEVDIVAKYVERLLAGGAGGSSDG